MLSGSISEPTLPITFHTPHTSHGVAIVGIILGKKAQETLFVAGRPHLQAADWRD